MPGFFVGGVFGFLAVGSEEDGGLGVGGGEGEDVPDVGGDDVSGEEVDLRGSVGRAIVVEAAAVGLLLAALQGAFDLDAEEVAEVVDGEVVGGVVAAGLGKDESEFGGAELEAEFGPLSAEFGVLDVYAFGHAVIRLCGSAYGRKKVPRDETARNDKILKVLGVTTACLKQVPRDETARKTKFLKRSE